MTLRLSTNTRISPIWRNCFGDINNVRTVCENVAIMDHLTFPSFPYYEIVSELQDGISPSTIVEKYKAVAQTAVDEVYKD